jgi:hypothetical protein
LFHPIEDFRLVAMAPDRQSADAAAATAVSNMHDVVVQNAYNMNIAPGQKASDSQLATAVPEITRRDVHTASSISAQRKYHRTNSKDTNLAHQAVIRRSEVKAKKSAQAIPPESSSAGITKPVLVRASSNKIEMGRKTKTRVPTESPQLPPLESFSIQDILNSIGPEAESSIDAIAEICGRSKMSLADEHSSHRPPHLQVETTGDGPAESIPSTHLEPVVEGTSVRPHTRSKTRGLGLVGAFPDREVISGKATAATSRVTSQAQAKITKPTRDNTSAEVATTPLLSQVLAWLRQSIPGSEAASTSDRDIKVENSLRHMLNNTDSIRS